MYVPNIAKCFEIGETNYCEIVNPVFRAEKYNECEWQLFNNETASNCKYDQITRKEEWTNINRNEWLFSVLEAINVSIICDDEANKIQLKGSGSIRFQSDCRLVTEEVEIKTKTKIASDAEATKIQMHHVEWPKLHSNASFKFAKKLQKIENSEWWHNLHHYSWIYTILAILVGIVIYFYNKLELQKSPSHKNST